MMIALLLILGGLLTYLLFSKGFWLDKWAKYSKTERKSWKGEDVEPDYNTNQKIQEGIPFVRSLDKKLGQKRWEDPEVPYRKGGRNNK